MRHHKVLLLFSACISLLRELPLDSGRFDVFQARVVCSPALHSNPYQAKLASVARLDASIPPWLRRDRPNPMVLSSASLAQHYMYFA